jgi:hypothetical protein
MVIFLYDLHLVKRKLSFMSSARNSLMTSQNLEVRLKFYKKWHVMIADSCRSVIVRT